MLDFTVEAADTAADGFLGYSATGQVTGFSSIPRSRVSGGGNLTEATSSVLTITGGTAAVLTSGLTIQVKLATTGQSGYLSSTDWNTFNNKMGTTLTSAFIFVGNGSNIATGVAMTGPIAITNTGLTSIVAGSIVNADVNNSAAIALTKLAATTASRAIVSNGSGFFTAATTTATEIGFVNGVTSAIQTQLNTKLTVTLTSPTSGDIITYNGSAWVNSAVGAGTIPIGGTTNQILRKIDATNYNTEWHTLVVADLTNLTATVTELNQLTGVTTTTAQYNFINTLSSNAQTQINSKLTNSLTLNGMWIGNSSNVATVLAPGTDTYVLTSAAGVPTWAPSASVALTDGNGTTANGTAVDLGGTLNSHVSIDGIGTYDFILTGGNSIGIDGADVTIAAIGSIAISSSGSTVDVSATSMLVTTPIINFLGDGVSAAIFRFYEPNIGNYSGIRAGVQSTDVTYTLPTAAPASNGYGLTSTTAGVMSWAAVIGGSTGSTDSAILVANGTGGVTLQASTSWFLSGADIVSAEINKTIVRKRILENALNASSKQSTVVASSEIANGEAVTMLITIAGKDASSNTGFGGHFMAIWTKSGGTLQLVGETGGTLTSDTGDTVTIASSDSAGDIVVTLSTSGGAGNFNASMVADLTFNKA